MSKSTSASLSLKGQNNVDFTKEIRDSYSAYIRMVVGDRALPDVRDGLKPVQRRILFAMKEGNYDSSHPHRKCARIVGDVMGKYHPHGDSAIYDALVRMGQDFVMRLPLIDGQGNFGSIDGDNPAAMRYTEARTSFAAEDILGEIDKETVDFQSNYDNALLEPVVLPARFPSLLVNGSTGIAVGMSTKIPPHNLGEIFEVCRLLLKNRKVSDDEIFKVFHGPDFPTGASFSTDMETLRSIYATGRGTISLSSRSKIEEGERGKKFLVFYEIPYQTKKTDILVQIGKLLSDKKIAGITSIIC